MSRQAWGVCALFGALSLIQSIAEPSTGLVAQPTLSLLRSWGNEAGDVTTFMALVTAPWWLKPLYGWLSDFVPLGGYRRKSYLSVATFATTVCFVWLYALPHSSETQNRLFVALFLAVLSLAVSDVVLDALMIETGQSLRITGRLQAVGGAAGSVAFLLTGRWGGHLSQSQQHALGFWACAALSAASLVLVIVYLRESPQAAAPPDRRQAGRMLVATLRAPGLWSVAAFFFAWHFNPLSPSVLYMHMKGPLGISEETIGDSLSLNAIGSLAAAAVYALVCRRVAIGWLVPGAVVCGAISTLVYWPMSAGCDLTWISLAAGFSYAIAMTILLDLAARACPLLAAGTVFALWMALCNVSTALSTWVGGLCYEAWSDRWGSSTGFCVLLAFGAGCTLCSWLFARRLPRDLLG
ncbi:MAG TPA: MFS transporter [Pirellulales bacterium]|nr:MFS transporter [Pirellulales bacterium]